MATNSVWWVAPIGRALLSLIFIASAAGKLQDWQPAAQMIADKGLPAVDALLSVAVGLELVGGVLVLLGLYARWGALALLAFLVPVTVIMHNFWAVPEAESMNQMINFMKNVSIAGGLLMVVALGAGSVSIDALRQKRPSGPPHAT